MGYKLRAVATSSLPATLVIPDEVAEDIDAMYNHLTKNPGQEVIYESDRFPEVDAEGKPVELDAEGHPLDKKVKAFTDDELSKAAALFLKQAQAYGKAREAGSLKVRQLPSKHLPAGTIRLQITADVVANGERNGQTGPVAGLE